MNVKIITLCLICVLLLMLVSCSSSRDPYEPTYSYFNEKAETPDPTDSEEIAEGGYVYDPSCFTTGGYTNQWMGLSFTPHYKHGCLRPGNQRTIQSSQNE